MKITYEKPKLEFQELYLFDGVAEKCWGNGSIEFVVYKDSDHDMQYDEGEQILVSETLTPDSSGGNHCGELSNKAAALASKYPEYADYLYQINTGTNSKTLGSTWFPVS